MYINIVRSYYSAINSIATRTKYNILSALRPQVYQKQVTFIIFIFLIDQTILLPNEGFFGIHLTILMFTFLYLNLEITAVRSWQVIDHYLCKMLSFFINPRSWTELYFHLTFPFVRRVSVCKISKKNKKITR